MATCVLWIGAALAAVLIVGAFVVHMRANWVYPERKDDGGKQS